MDEESGSSVDTKITKNINSNLYRFILRLYGICGNKETNSFTVSLDEKTKANL